MAQGCDGWNGKDDIHRVVDHQPLMYFECASEISLSNFLIVSSVSNSATSLVETESTTITCYTMVNLTRFFLLLQKTCIFTIACPTRRQRPKELGDEARALFDVAHQFTATSTRSHFYIYW